MKNLKSTEPIFLEDKYGWTSDVYDGEKSSYKTDICTVWGKSKEELEQRVMMIRKVGEMLEALKRVMSGKKYGDVEYIRETGKIIQSLIKEIES